MLQLCSTDGCLVDVHVLNHVLNVVLHKCAQMVEEEAQENYTLSVESPRTLLPGAITIGFSECCCWMLRCCESGCKLATLQCALLVALMLSVLKRRRTWTRGSHGTHGLAMKFCLTCLTCLTF